jgi:hypothetical protein
MGGGLHEVGRRPVGQPVGGLGGPRLMVRGGLGPPAEPLLGRWSATIPSCALLSPLTGKLPGLSLHAGDEAAGDRLHGALQLIQVQLILGPFQQASLARGQGRLGGVACLVLRRGIRVLQDRRRIKEFPEVPALLLLFQQAPGLDLHHAGLCQGAPLVRQVSLVHGVRLLLPGLLRQGLPAQVSEVIRGHPDDGSEVGQGARRAGFPAVEGIVAPPAPEALPALLLPLDDNEVGGKPSRLLLEADKGQQAGPLVQLHGDVDAVIRHALEPGHHAPAQPDDPAEMAQDCDQGLQLQVKR